jgi:cephalosporin hydroxylase
MVAYDDRKEFEKAKRADALALGNDDALFRMSAEMIHAADRYRYAYLWSWLGVPIIQLPADILATQEVIWATKPDIIIETGVARGGSVLFMASILEVIGKGLVIGVDVDIRAHNRESIERHPMGKRVMLVEGSSVDEAVVGAVKSKIPKDASVMVVLDSDHSRDHVLAELRAYGSLVTEGCYLVVADTLLGFLDGELSPRKQTKLWLKGDEPLAALRAYMGETDGFEIDDVLNAKLILANSPGGYLRCKRKQA